MSYQFVSYGLLNAKKQSAFSQVKLHRNNKEGVHYWVLNAETMHIFIGVITQKIITWVSTSGF